MTTDTNTTLVCSVDGCDEPCKAKSYCKRHYQRFLRTGDATQNKVRGKPLAWLKDAIQQETDECLIWPFSKTGKDYGNLKYEGKVYRASRLVLILHTGENPRHMEACHAPHDVCGSKLCCNPRHLRWGTRTENERNKIADGTSNQGERHHKSKLTELDVREIRARCANGENQRVISEEYGVAAPIISLIKNRKIWKHVE